MIIAFKSLRLVFNSIFTSIFEMETIVKGHYLFLLKRFSTTKAILIQKMTDISRLSINTCTSQYLLFFWNKSYPFFRFYECTNHDAHTFETKTMRTLKRYRLSFYVLFTVRTLFHLNWGNVLKFFKRFLSKNDHTFLSFLQWKQTLLAHCLQVGRSGLQQ